MTQSMVASLPPPTVLAETRHAFVRVRTWTDEHRAQFTGSTYANMLSYAGHVGIVDAAERFGNPASKQMSFKSTEVLTIPAPAATHVIFNDDHHLVFEDTWLEDVPARSLNPIERLMPRLSTTTFNYSRRR